MFYQALNSSLSLASDVADEIFPLIKAQPYNGDATFCATLRALIQPRLPKDMKKPLQLVFSEEIIANSISEEGFLREVLPKEPLEPESILIRLYKTGNNEKQDALDAYQEKIVSAFNKNFKGFVLDEKAGAWFLNPGAGGIRALLFTNAEKHITVLFVDGMNVRRLHTIQALLPRLLPWYFEGENAAIAGSEDRELLRSLLSPFHDKIKEEDKELPGYSVLIEKYAEKYDFRTAKINRYLANFVKSALAGQKRSIEREIQDIQSSINELQSRVSENYARKDELSNKLFGIKYREQNNDDDRLRAYFAANRNVDLVSMENGTLRFATYAWLEWWDEEKIRMMIGNKNADLYSIGIDKKDAELFYNALFIDRTIHMRTCACYDVRLDHCSVSAVSDFDGYREMDTRLVNPHILHYSCIGSYEEQFRRYMVSGEYIGVVETAIASTKSVAPSDPSFNQMISDFRHNLDKKFFEFDDGRIVSIKEAVKLLKKGEHKK